MEVCHSSPDRHMHMEKHDTPSLSGKGRGMKSLFWGLGQKRPGQQAATSIVNKIANISGSCYGDVSGKTLRLQ